MELALKKTRVQFSHYPTGTNVYIRHDPEQMRMMITDYSYTARGLTYQVSLGMETTWVYDYEISTEQDQIAKFNQN